MKGGDTYHMFIERCRNIIQRFLDYPQTFPESVRSTRKHFEKSKVFVRAKVKLTPREISKIRTNCLVKMEHIIEIEARIEKNMGSESDEEEYEKFKALIQTEQEAALKKKIECPMQKK